MPDWNVVLKEIQDNLLELEVEIVMEYWHKRVDDIYTAMER